ncbi:AAA family ATPase [Micromonospora chalcea]
MHLVRLSLSDFRAFRDAEMALPSHGLVLLAGPNSVGKSSVLSALDVAAGGPVPSAARHMGGNAPRIKVRFALSDEERDSLSILRAQLRDFPKAEVGHWLEWEFAVDDDGQSYATRVATSWIEGAELDLARLSWNRSGMELHLVTLPLPENPNAADYRMVASSSRFYPWLESDGQTEYVADIVELLKSWRAAYFHFPAMRTGTSRDRPMRSEPILQPSGENLPAVLLNLQTNKPDLWSRVQEWMSKLLPEVGLLQLSTASDKLAITFADSGYPAHRHNLKDLGTGVEQVLLALTVGLAQEHASFVAIEEPETALHPAAQRAMLALFHEWSGNRTFILTTHSPVFLDSELGRPIIYALKREAGRSSVFQADPSLVDVMESLGGRLSDVLSADRILLVEGPSDRDVLSAWWPEIVSDPRVSVITGQGGRNARFARTLDEWLSQVDRLGRRKVLYIRDRDELPPAIEARMVAEPTVHLLERREMENYLLDPAVLISYFKGQGCVVSHEEMESSLIEAADQLRPLVILKGVLARLEPFYYVDDRFRAQLVKRCGGLDDLVQQVSDRLPRADDVENRIRNNWAEVSEAVTSKWASRR